MRKWFFFCYHSNMYQMIALPVGWTRSPGWFVKIFKRMIKYVQQKMRHRIYVYMDSCRTGSQEELKEGLSKSHERAALASRIPGDEVASDKKRKARCNQGVKSGSKHRHATGESHCAVGEKDTGSESTRHDSKGGKEKESSNPVTVDAQADTVRETNFLSAAIPLAYFYIRALYESLGSKQVNQKIRVSHRGMKDLAHWAAIAQLQDSEMNLSRLWKLQNFDLAAHMDSSPYGLRASLNEDLSSDQESSQCMQEMWFRKDQMKHINRKELKAVHLALTLFHTNTQNLAAKSMLLRIDNQVVVQNINKRVSRSQQLMKELRKLQTLIAELNLQIQAQWLSSLQNKHADRLSREFAMKGDQRINHMLLEKLKSQYQCDSRRIIAQSTRQDFDLQCLDDRWTQPTALWAPLPVLMGSVVQKLISEKCKDTLVDARWPNQSWFLEM